MKNIVKALLVTAILSAPTFAENHHGHGDSEDKPGMGMKMGMMDHEQMADRMKMMEGRMNMMQMMMGQMVEHQAQDRKSRPRHIKR